MGRLFKVLLFLIVIGAIGIVGYGYLGSLNPPQEERSIPVELNGG